MNEKNNENDENPLTEEELKELNLYIEERRQESIAKYGRDIYSENRQIGNKKTQKINGFIDKICNFFLNNFYLILFIILISILIMVWIPVISSYS